MKKINITVLSLMMYINVSFANDKHFIKFEDLFPTAQQSKIGINKLSSKEKEALHSHVENLLLMLTKSKQQSNGGMYSGGSGGHWISKNIDSGSFMILEDNSFWKIDPYDKTNAMLWLPISNITITESSNGSPGFDYLLINTDDGEKAHAKYMGQK